uniref:Uncharacterized protein n=1 Tax=Schistocephalus solidus TaxID=70667 RepID=A0A0V0J7T3_SCHSO
MCGRIDVHRRSSTSRAVMKELAFFKMQDLGTSSVPHFGLWMEIQPAKQEELRSCNSCSACHGDHTTATSDLNARIPTVRHQWMDQLSRGPKSMNHLPVTSIRSKEHVANL